MKSVIITDLNSIGFTTNNLLDSNFDLTFQYRTTKINDFNPECDLQLGIYYLIEIKNKIKSYSHFQNKIGIAIDSFDDFELIVENFDFIKILSFTENKKEFFNKINCQKPIYLSCGLEKLNNIEEYHNIARKEIYYLILYIQALIFLDMIFLNKK